MNKESFVGAFNDWYEKYKDIVNERVQDKRIKRKTPPYMRPGFVAPTLVQNEICRYYRLSMTIRNRTSEYQQCT